ncbi:MAG: LCP family protein [Patescibacteria group bacterium]
MTVERPPRNSSAKHSGQVKQLILVAAALGGAGYLLIAHDRSPQDIPTTPTTESLSDPFKSAEADLDTAEPASTKEKQMKQPAADRENLFKEVILGSLQEFAQGRRAEKSKDPEFTKRIDQELNKKRINFLLAGIRGTEEEPFLTDSMQIISLNYEENTIDIIALHRDTEAPEIAGFLGTSKPFRINTAYLLGGLPLTEKVVEDATGLAIDSTMVIKMELLKEAVEKIFGNRLEITLDWEINDSNMGYFPKGKQELNGEEVLRIARARYYASNYNRNILQQKIIESMFSRLQKKSKEGFMTKILTVKSIIDLLESGTKEEKITGNLPQNLFPNLGWQIIQAIWSNGNLEFALPTLGSTFVFAQETGTLENAGDPDDLYRLKTRGGWINTSDPINDYWLSARRKIREIILGN